MRRIALYFASGLLIASPAFAEDPATPAQKAPAAHHPGAAGDAVSTAPAMADLESEVHTMHHLLDQQAKQLEVLARELAQVSQQVGELHGSAPAVIHPEPASAVESAPPPPPAAAEIPKAEPVSSAAAGLKHPVEKGETLTSIAKHYNIAVADLQKANKIQNDRKLQIGQILSIPATKAPEPPTEKKENP